MSNPGRSRSDSRFRRRRRRAAIIFRMVIYSCGLNIRGERGALFVGERMSACPFGQHRDHALERRDVSAKGGVDPILLRDDSIMLRAHLPLFQHELFELAHLILQFEQLVFVALGP